MMEDDLTAAQAKVSRTLAEYTRVSKVAFYGRHAPNNWYGTDLNPRSGLYKEKSQVVWGVAIDMALKAHKDALKELRDLQLSQLKALLKYAGHRGSCAQARAHPHEIGLPHVCTCGYTKLLLGED